MHRKQTPFVVVGSLKIYENLHDLGWYGRRLCGDFPTVFLYEVGACADPRIFAGGGGGGGVQARLPENNEDMYVIQSLHFFTYVHERAFHLYTRAILALKFEADKECFNLRRQRSCQTL